MKIEKPKSDPPRYPTTVAQLIEFNKLALDPWLSLLVLPHRQPEFNPLSPTFGFVTSKAQAMDFAREPEAPAFKGLGDNVIDPKTSDADALIPTSSLNLDGESTTQALKLKGVTAAKIGDSGLTLSDADIDRLADSIVRRWKRLREDKERKRK